jgi:hypothetical protein
MRSGSAYGEAGAMAHVVGAAPALSAGHLLLSCPEVQPWTQGCWFEARYILREHPRFCGV